MAPDFDCLLFIEAMSPVDEVVKQSPVQDSVGGHLFFIEAKLLIGEDFKETSVHSWNTIGTQNYVRRNPTMEEKIFKYAVLCSKSSKSYNKISLGYFQQTVSTRSE
jgi:hypothetical protein